MAEWVGISRNEDFGITVYADPATTRKSGNEVKMWVLVDYKTAQGKNTSRQHMSSKRQDEYDCKEVKLRVIFESDHSGNMGRGKIVRSSKNFGWQPVAPDTLDKHLWNLPVGSDG